MARSLPVDGIGNRGDAVRLALAGTEFVNPCCANDPRVRESYRSWARQRDLGPLVAHLRAVPHDVDAVYAFGQALGSNDDLLNRTWAARLVDDVLRVPYRWVGRLLIVQFGLWACEAAGRPAEKVMLLPGDLAGLPKGRLPRLNGRQIPDAVRWLYRREVTAPPDELHVLVEEYVRGRRAHGVHTTHAHSVVQGGIQQAHILLTLIQLK